MTPKNPYRATGIGSAYIEREADQRLRRELSDNRRFPFIAAAPDSGKTALLRHTAAVLDPSQYCALAVDVSRIRLVGFTQFMGELLLAVAREGDLDKREIHPEAPEDTFLAWLGVFPQRFILMLDGVEALQRADFLHEFLGKLRFLHSVRAENREFSRLQIVLAAATHINRMVPVGLRSPFAGALELWLRALTVDQVESLAWSLGTAKVDVDVHVGAVLHRHTGGQPYLCQHILATLWDEAHSSSVGVTAQSINRVVEDLLDRAPSIEHFARIFRTVSSDPMLVDSFARMLRGEAIDPDRQLDLRVTGLVGPDSPYACNLYERVFGPGGPLQIPLASPVVAVSEPAPAALELPPLPVDEEAAPVARPPSEPVLPPAPLVPAPLPPSLDLEALAEPPPRPAPEPPTPSRDRDEPSLPPVTSSSITPNLFAQPLEIRAPLPPPRTASAVTPVMASRPLPAASEPRSAISAPAPSARTPVFTPNVPAARPAEPSAVSNAPAATASEPAAATSEPVVATSEPAAATSEPVAATSEPAAATSEPVAATSEPVAATSEPVAATSEPAAATSEPAAATSEPVAATSEPATATSEPVVAMSELVAATSEPVVATSEPVAATREPVAATSEAVAATSEPATATSEPAAATSETAAATSEPAAATGEPAAAASEPAAAASPSVASPIVPIAAADSAVPVERALSAVTPTREVPVANMAADIAQSRATPKYGTPLTLPAPPASPSLPPASDDEGPTQVDAASRRLSSHTPRSLPPDAIQLLDEPSAVERRKELVDVVLAQSAPVIEPLLIEPTVPNAPAVPQPVAPVRSGPVHAPPPPIAAHKPASPEPSKAPEPVSRPEAAAPAMATSQPLTVGVGLVLANRYFLTCEIGQGAVAQVWNAYDRIKDEQVALKLLAGPAADNPQLVERFWRSAQQMSALSHPAIVGVLNKPREENGIHYVVTVAPE
ncbi:MAG: AAA-like domain-containing protein [Polyangia bacterium]